MSDKCNPTGAQFNIEWMLRQLTGAEAWAKNKYKEDLEKAIVERIGLIVPVKGWKGLILRRKRFTTREDAIKMVTDDSGDFWYNSIEYSLRTDRDSFLRDVKSLRQSAITASGANLREMFVSKADMVYLS